MPSSMLSKVKRRVGRRLMRRATDGTLDLARLRVIPHSVSMPLRRNGVDPVPDLGKVRESEPVHLLKRLFGLNIWIVTGYDQARAVLADTGNFSNDIRPMVGGGDSAGAEGIGGLGFTDPPDHTRLRKFLTPEFTMRKLARLEPLIAGIVDKQLDEVAAAGPVADLVPKFAFPVPFQAISELLGLPVEDRERFRQLGPARFDLSQGGPGVFGSATESRQFLIEMVAKQRQNPGDGLIGGIIREHGDEVDDIELGGLADGVFLGGYETSASMLALGTLVLLQNPEVYAAVVRDDEGEVDRIVEELLRYLGVVQVAFPRFARHDMDLFGRPVKKGDLVSVSLSGANRDHDMFGADADAFNPHRMGGHGPGSTHLAFGHGFHRCVGSELARMELRCAFRALAKRFPDMSLAVRSDQLRFRDFSVVYGIETLPVRLTAADSFRAAG
jgi:cytochrome P450